jgi:hypothetical protein
MQSTSARTRRGMAVSVDVGGIPTVCEQSSEGASRSGGEAVMCASRRSIRIMIKFLSGAREFACPASSENAALPRSSYNGLEGRQYLGDAKQHPARSALQGDDDHERLARIARPTGWCVPCRAVPNDGGLLTSWTVQRQRSLRHLPSLLPRGASPAAPPPVFDAPKNSAPSGSVPRVHEEEDPHPASRSSSPTRPHGTR